MKKDLENYQLFEQSMGSTYYGSAQLTPEMMGRRHFEDQVKHVERLTQSLHELRIELSAYPENQPHIFENPFTQKFPDNAPHIFENPDVAFEDTERGKQNRKC